MFETTNQFWFTGTILRDHWWICHVLHPNPSLALRLVLTLVPATSTGETCPGIQV